MLIFNDYIRGITALHDILNSGGCKSDLLKWIMGKFAPDVVAPVRHIMEETMEPDAKYSKRPVDSRNSRVWALKVSGLCLIYLVCNCVANVRPG